MGCASTRLAGLLAGSALVGGLLATAPASAQDAATLQSIQAQIAQLQAQLKQLQRQAAQNEAALKKAQSEAAEARQDAQNAQKAAAAAPPSPAQAALPAVATLPAGALIVTQPPNDKDAQGNPIQNPNKPNGKFNIGGVTISLGGFVDLTMYDRSRNENRGTATSFSGIPFNGPTPQGNASEFNMTAQQTRLSLRADANINASSTVTGYVESDFNNGAGNANSVQSNSYTPRLRQAFVDYAYNPWQFYALGGQAWSLASPFRKGLDPFQVWQPPTIDTAYLPGYAYLRVPVVRAVKGVGPATFGLELDAPQTVFGGTPPTIVNGAITTAYAGNGGLNPQANYSVNSVPDLIGKAAVDTSFGHYEVYGVVRQFQDQLSYSLNGAANTKGGSNNYHANGGGVGGSLFIPVMKYADIEGSVLSGSGIGRYGSGGLPDVTFARNGSPVPLPETMWTIGAIGHVLPTLDLYLFGGVDQIGKSYFGATGGYGNPLANNAGCFNPNAGAGCTGNNYQLDEITAGYNWKIFSGSYGTISTGLQYAYAVRQAYGAKGGAPNGIENMIFANLRYTPFQ